MKRVLVIGGNRFFGKRLVARLLADGHKVTLLNRGQATDDFGEHVERIRLDRKTLTKETTELRGRSWDVVYDQVCYDAPEAEAACGAFGGKVGHYVFTSSQSVYDGGCDLAESTFDPRTHDYASRVNRDQDYSEAKRQAEAAFFQKATVPVTAVRFPIVLGPDDYTQRLVFHVERIRDGRPIYFPNLDARISFIHSADAATFLHELVGREAVGPINVCAPQPIVLRDLVTQVEARTGRKMVGATQTSPEATSPFGIAGDWYMSTEKLRQQEFTPPRPIAAWLPELVAHILNSVPKSEILL